MSVRNEASNISRKIENLLQSDYPPESLQLVVVSDGSTDETEEILRKYPDRVTTVVSSESVGKAAALMLGLREAEGEVIVFTDARQVLATDAIRQMTSCFGDVSVGCVSGELMIRDSETGNAKGLGMYWRLEKFIRELESRTGSVVGATGAIYSARRTLIPQLDAGTILDDVAIPMGIARQGYRVIFEPNAKAWDTFSEDGHEFRRKVRTLCGNYQLTQFAPWLIGPKNPLLFRFISHKLLRLLVPFLLIITLATSAMLQGSLYRMALAAQLGVLLLAGIALLKPRFNPLQRLTDVSFAFVSLNAAALVAFLYFISGKKGMWVR
jgi:cellulose synthase/poly-beta-1,6-N-acetylglucosamine synthase-like glycosyltransferase